jgi:hypothetical protein
MTASWPFVALALLLSVAAQAQSQPDLSDADIDTLATQPGTEVTRTQEGDTQIIEIRRAGVVITIRHKGDKADSVGQDNSGHGAVLCMWRLYISFRQGLNLCFLSQYPEFKEDLNYAVGAMNDFIAANSLAPTSKEEVEAAVATLDERAKKQGDEATAQLGGEEFQRRCTSRDFGRGIVKMAEMTREQRRRQISDLLSVPRPPVMNPCM